MFTIPACVFYVTRISQQSHTHLWRQAATDTIPCCLHYSQDIPKRWHTAMFDKNIPRFKIIKGSFSCNIFCIHLIFCSVYCQVSRSIKGRDSSVGIATRYGLDGPGIESRWGRDFPHLPRPALGPTQPPVRWVPGLSRG